MKKILPILSILSIATIFGGCNMAKISTPKDNFQDNIANFKERINQHNISRDVENAKNTIGKYTMSIKSPIDDSLSNDKVLNLPDSNKYYDASNMDIDQGFLIDDGQTKDDASDLDAEQIDNKISTLYSISQDLTDYCDEYCELKEKVNMAIEETQKLISKINSKEISLSVEQRMLLKEQSNELKNLGRELANVTTELNFQLSDLAEIMNSQDIDTISLKYLMVLDNLINGNEMLENGLQSLNLINTMINMQNDILPPNAKGRILYGFKENNNQPIINDYIIDENGQITQNNQNQNNNQTNDTQNDSKNIDTYINPNLNTNIDTYGTYNRNIDSFFNTALLDNEFMFGNNGNYGYNLGYYPNYNQNNMPYNNYGANNINGFNPYINQYNQYQGLNRDFANQQDNNQGSNQTHKRKKLTSNIDTYKDDNTPSPKTKLNQIKTSISSFFDKFSRPKKDEIKNPIFELNQKDEN